MSWCTVDGGTLLSGAVVLSMLLLVESVEACKWEIEGTESITKSMSFPTSGWKAASPSEQWCKLKLGKVYQKPESHGGSNKRGLHDACASEYEKKLKQFRDKL